MNVSAYKHGYDASYAGAKFVAQGAKDGYVPEIRTLGGENVVDLKSGEYVIATGEYFYLPDYPGIRYYQTTYGIYFVSVGDYSYTGWKIYSHAINLPKYSRDDAQRLVNGIIENNIHIVENNLLCARFADKFTPEQRKQIAELQKRVQERWDAIKNDGYCEDIQESYPKGYADLEPYLAQLMKTEGIGIVWWAACIIVAIVIGGLGAAAYFVYRDLFQESKEDVKYSDELTKILQEKLTEEEYQQLLNETQGIVTKAKIRAKLGSYGTVLKVAGIMIAGALAYKFIFK